jgi:hypothetical protein
MRPEEPALEGSVPAISRRKLLKRIGAGAAIAWATPVLSTVRTPAFAQSPPFPCRSGGECLPCNSCSHHPCGPSDLCTCLPPIDECTCECGDFPSFFCADYQPCEQHGDCPAGERCFAACCPTGICRGPCTGSRKPKMRGSGPKVTAPV